jgi:WD40 repeat protein
MLHSLAFVTWANGVHELLMLRLHIPGLCGVVTTYAREFLGETLHVIPNATGADCLVAALFGDRMVTADGCQIYVCGAFDGTRRTLAGHTACIFEISVLDNRIASCSKDCTARVWDSETGECLQILAHPDWVVDVIQMQPCEIVTCCNDNYIRVWLDGQCVAQSLKTAVMLVPLAHRKFISCSFDDHLHVWDRVQSPHIPTYVNSEQAAVMHMVALDDGRFATHDGKHIVVWNSHCSVLKIDCRTTELCALEQGLLAAGSPDGTVRVWDTRTAECIWTLIGHSAIVWSLSAMPDKKLASGSADRTVRVWDLTTGQCVHVLSNPTSCVKGLVSLEHTLFALGIDHTVCVWE